MEVEIFITADGSHSLLNPVLKETYHSVHGAIQESIHVFLTNGLEYVAARKKENIPLRILEVGFGTGLNALLTSLYSVREGLLVHYCSLEAFPISTEIAGQLNYPITLKQDGVVEQFRELHASPWNMQINISENFKLEKRHVKLEDATFAGEPFDLVYFDAFAPNKQPEMWEITILEKVTRTMAAGGVFVTYCAKGQLKRDLRALGLTVETLQGPPGKKEMVRAIRSGAL